MAKHPQAQSGPARDVDRPPAAANQPGRIAATLARFARRDEHGGTSPDRRGGSPEVRSHVPALHARETGPHRAVAGFGTERYQLPPPRRVGFGVHPRLDASDRSEEHTSELQSPKDLVCRLLLEKKKN